MVEDTLLTDARVGRRLFLVMAKCDLLAISDGSSHMVTGAGPNRYAISFAQRNGDVMDYVEGNDLAALLEEVLRRVS